MDITRLTGIHTAPPHIDACRSMSTVDSMSIVLLGTLGERGKSTTSENRRSSGELANNWSHSGRKPAVPSHDNGTRWIVVKESASVISVRYTLLERSLDSA